MIILRKLDHKKDVGQKYLGWMNDKKVHKYTQQCNKTHSIKKIKDFVIRVNRSKNEFLYGIFLKKKNNHIGNIKIGPINNIHKTAYISYFIGQKNQWGKGYAAKAIKLSILEAKKKKIKKLKAKTYKINKGSISVLKKNNFKIEGLLKKEIKFKNKRIDEYIFGKII